jgi:hypothetical protein
VIGAYIGIALSGAVHISAQGSPRFDCGADWRKFHRDDAHPVDGRLGDAHPQWMIAQSLIR